MGSPDDRCRRPSGARRKVLSVTASINTVIEAIDRRAPGVIELAELLAPAVRIDSILVRRLRLDLLPRWPASTEAQLWFSPLVQGHSQAGISFSVAAAVALRRRLATAWTDAARRPLLERARSIYEDVHGTLPAPLLLEERLAWDLVAGDVTKADERLRGAIAAYLTEPEQFRFWISQAAGRVPDAVSMAPTGSMVLRAASEETHNGELWEEGYQNLDTRSLAVIHRRNTITFGALPGPGVRRIQVPDSRAVRLVTTWSSGEIPGIAEIVVESDGEPVILTVDGDVQVRTASGLVYRIPADPLQRSARVSSTLDPEGKLHTKLASGELLGVRPADGSEPPDLDVQPSPDGATIVDVAGSSVDVASQPDVDIVDHLAAVLEHLCRWFAIGELANAAARPLSPVLSLPSDPSAASVSADVVPYGSAAKISILNRANEDVFVALLVLTESTREVRVFQSPRPLGPDQRWDAEVSFSNPGAYHRLIAIACRNPFDPQLLALPPVGTAKRGVLSTGSDYPTSLDSLFALLAGGPQSVGFNDDAAWGATELVVRVQQATSAVRVRMYNVGFGDCFLVTFSTSERPYTMLVDCGRHQAGASRTGPDFWSVVESLIADLPIVDGARRIDVLAITNPHTDHVYGFSRPELWKDISVGEVWMSWTRDPNAAGIGQRPTTNAKAFATLAELGKDRSRYLPRPDRYPDTLDGASLPFLPTDVTVHVLGPSRDLAVIRTMSAPAGEAFDSGTGAAASSSTETANVGDDGSVESYAVDESDEIGSGFDQSEGESTVQSTATLADLSQFVNGTSLVLLIEVAGQKLLFASDAMWGTWQMMLGDPTANALLRGVNFYKVGHHGSRNGTPREFVEGDYLSDAVAMVSVSPVKAWRDIPNRTLLSALEASGTRVIRSDAPVSPRASGVARSPADPYTEVTFQIQTVRRA
jgi:beta-lactamase superfamily II metal-dependent hydrolase